MPEIKQKKKADEKYQHYVCDGYICSNSPNIVRYADGTTKEVRELEEQIERLRNTRNKTRTYNNHTTGGSPAR